MRWCCGLFSGSELVPEGYNELSAAELQQLYIYSTNLNGGRLIVQGLFARADCQNTNGRVYPKPILQREVAAFKERHVNKGTALGELNHPSYFSSYFRHLNLPNVSHQVLDLRWRGPELWGTLEVLPTPAGLLLSELYSKGIKLGVSSRGWASVVTDPHSKQVVVEPDYQLITFDFVPEPSNAGAYMVPICKRYRKRLPDQSAAVSISYLGIGSISMGNLGQLPPAAVLRRWLKHTSRAMDAAAKHPGQVGLLGAASSSAAGSSLAPPPCAAAAQVPAACLGAPSRTSSSYAGVAAVSMLDALGGCSQVLPPDTQLGGGVVLGCHYQVLQKSWLPLDSAVRQFKVHLSLMATKARLHQQQPHAGVPPADQQPQQPLVHQQQFRQPHQQPAQQQQQQQTSGQHKHLEQPLLLSQPSDTSSNPSSLQLPPVPSTDHEGSLMAAGALLHVTCDNDAYSDSSLGPGTPRTPRVHPLVQQQRQRADVKLARSTSPAV